MTNKTTTITPTTPTPETPAPETRYRVDYDPDARFEESNGEPRPLTEAEYRGNEYYGCPNHLRGDKIGDTTDNGVGRCARCGSRYQPIPYAEYLAYYGNPDRHVYLYVKREERCPCCGTWIAKDALYGIDFMDDSPEAGCIGTFTLAQLPGYLHEIATELD